MRINYLYYVSLIVVFLFGCGQEKPKENHADLKGKRPNILFVISDDQSYPHASAYGDKAIQTPAFDRVAREGVLFRQAFAASPGCSPSRAAILTGLNCWQIEEAGTHASSFPKKYIVFPDLLEQAGYYIGYTGKGWGPGDFEHSGRTRNPAGNLFSGNTLDAPEGISNTDYAKNFDDFLKGRPSTQPFFFWLGASEPHRKYKKGIGKEAGMDSKAVTVPAFLPDVEEVRSDILDYGYEIQWFDNQLAKVLASLEKSGELDNTIIVVTSDNGMPFPRAKANVYEYGIHMPLAIRWGNEVYKGRKIDDLVNLMDLCATFLEVAGAPFPDYPLESKSLLNILASKKQGIVDSSRKAVFASRERHSSSRWNNLGYPQRAIRTHQYLYVRNFKPERWPAGDPYEITQGNNAEENLVAYYDIDEAADNFVIKQRNNPDYNKYFQWAVGKRPAEELYDIKKDPGCLNNLADSSTYADESKALRYNLDGYLKRTQDPRITSQDEIFETYPRLKGATRQFPNPVKQTKALNYVQD